MLTVFRYSDLLLEESLRGVSTVLVRCGDQDLAHLRETLKATDSLTCDQIDMILGITERLETRHCNRIII